ncbi:hypothetical protein IQ250_18540 [Pseudanabaenaceae cyanobacterium LEGE 13415]|nr:hypothetical protein [Pseudanabaenaceae cyanobacterium LEGE 13415]
MNQPNFQAMSRTELHRYVLEHREDQAAFYAYVDKLHQEGTWVEMPPVESVEELENYPEFTAWIRRNSQTKPEN